MSRRVVVILLAAVIAAAIAIPALAADGGGAQSASVKGLSVRALAKAKKALRTARTAKRRVRRARRAAAKAQETASKAQETAGKASVAASGALSTAKSARTTATGAQDSSAAAQTALAARHAVSGFAAAAQATESEDFVALPGGPAVTVTVPDSRLIQLWAQATILEEGAVSLYQDGMPAPGTDCGQSTPGEQILFASPGAAEPGESISVATPAGFTCGNFGPPGPILIEAPAGRHTYELRYAACTCSGSAVSATFSERRLVVQPLP